MKLHLLAFIFFTTICQGQASGKPEDATHRVQAAINNFTKHPWGTYDWINGFVAGAYAPLAVLARRDDCFSRFFDWGIRMADMPHYFDKGFDPQAWGDYFGIFFKLFFFGLATYKTANACFTARIINGEIWQSKLDLAKEKEFEELDPGLNEFKKKNKKVDTKEEECVLNEEGECIQKKDRNLGKKIPYIFPLGIYIWKSYSTYMSEYLYWNFGYALGKLTSMFVVGLDLWFELDIFDFYDFRWVDFIDL